MLNSRYIDSNGCVSIVMLVFGGWGACPSYFCEFKAVTFREGKYLESNLISGHHVTLTEVEIYLDKVNRYI